MVVAVAVADRASVDDQAVVEEGAFALLDRFESLEQIGELLGVEAVDLANLCLLGGVALVVGEVVVALGNALGPIASVAPAVRQHEGRDARLVGLKRQGQEVMHKPNVLTVVPGDSRRNV